MSKKTEPKNLVLASLASTDFALLEPHLEPVDLPVRKVLERRGRAIKAVYFPNAGFASVVADGGRMPIEVGLIGREGATGIPIILGAERSEHETFVQAAGEGYCVRTSSLREVIDKSPSLHRVLLRAANGFLNQATRTAVANGRAKIDERLARWLLMADDRIDGDELPMTHEFLAMMLAVRRPGVTTAIRELERAGLITAKRSRITILDRDGLEKRSNGHYAQADYS
jgi:CRP-like cAMP-binding protein